MRLKHRRDIDYLDLPRLELPFFAKQWIENNLNINGFGTNRVEGLGGVIHDPLDRHRHTWDEYTYTLLLHGLERAEIFLVHELGSPPLSPIVKRETGKNGDIWHINDDLSHEQRFNVEWILASAISTKGAWQPIQQPVIEAPAPEPVAREEPKPLTVTNPRWEHVDDKRKEDSPEETMAGDTVTLMVDVTGVSDGARVTFKIVDTSISPPTRVAVVRGEVKGGIGKAEWEVKARRDGTKPEFVGEVRRVSSEQAEIPVTIPPVRFNIKLTDVPGKDGLPLPHREWRIVRAKTQLEAFLTDEDILTGESDSAGKLALTEEQEKTLQDALKQTPDQIWLVTPGKARQLILEIESDKWKDEDKLYRALDASGFTDQLKKVQGDHVKNSFFVELAKEDFGLETGDEIMASLKEEK